MVTANKEIKKPDDMKGMKLRVPPAPLYLMFAKSVGANATPIAFAEVYLALQQGTVDGQENPLPTIMAKKFYEVQSHIMLTGHITESLLTIVGSACVGKLIDADKKVFEEVLMQAAAKATDQIRASGAEARRRVRASSARPWSTVDREAFRQAAMPAAQRRQRRRRLEPGGIRRAPGAEVAVELEQSPRCPLRRRARGSMRRPAIEVEFCMTAAEPSARQPAKDEHLIVVEDEEVTIEHHPEDWMAFVAVLGARLHRLPAVLHPLRPQRQLRLDRGDRPLRADVARLHRRRRGDARKTRRSRSSCCSNVMPPGPARGAARDRRPRHARLPRRCSPTSP